MVCLCSLRSALVREVALGALSAAILPWEQITLDAAFVLSCVFHTEKKILRTNTVQGTKKFSNK
eukprot:3893450-Amphidinium_carterae.1